MCCAIWLTRDILFAFLLFWTSIHLYKGCNSASLLYFHIIISTTELNHINSTTPIATYLIRIIYDRIVSEILGQQEEMFPQFAVPLLSEKR